MQTISLAGHQALFSLRKHAYSNIVKYTEIFTTEKLSFQIKIPFFLFLLIEAVQMSTDNLCFWVE